MELKKRSNILIIITLLSLLGVFALGVWWLYLLIKISQLDPVAMKTNVVNLAKWEGSTFLFLLITLASSFLLLYFKELRQAKSLQNFFTSLTHELKTPLASIRLQSEVLADSLEKTLPESKEINFAERLIEDTQNLETQMDKIIQLSRITRGGKLHLRPINISDIVKNMVKNYAGDLEIEVTGLSSEKVRGDQFAIELILKNLMENTKHHSKNIKAQICLKKINEEIEISYRDEGKFTGDNKKLGKLFYTNHSSRGSGIGLYLCGKLLLAMKSNINISAEDSFKVTFNLSRVSL
jgi:signal transduction histidine kinase